MSRNKLSVRRVRSRSHVVRNPYSTMVAHYAYQQDTTDWRTWTFRPISERSARILVATGDAECVTREVLRDDKGQTIRPDQVAKHEGPVSRSVEVVGYRALKPTSWERPSPTTLTFGTMQAVVGAQVGRHATREVHKFLVWPLIGDTKAVAVRPRMSTTEMQEAAKLMPLTESEQIVLRKRMAQVERATAARVA